MASNRRHPVSPMQCAGGFSRKEELACDGQPTPFSSARLRGSWSTLGWNWPIDDANRTAVQILWIISVTGGTLASNQIMESLEESALRQPPVPGHERRLPWTMCGVPPARLTILRPR
jgi:hypothetical protein